MSKTISVEAEVNISDFNNHDLIDEIEDRGFSVYERESPVKKIAETLQNSNHQFNIGLDTDKMSRFAQVHHLIKWEQWNEMFCKVEKMSFEERNQLPSKYNVV